MVRKVKIKCQAFQVNFFFFILVHLGYTGHWEKLTGSEQEITLFHWFGLEIKVILD